MNSIIDNIVRNAHILVENQKNEPITKTNPYMYNASHLCITYSKDPQTVQRFPETTCDLRVF